MDSMSSNNRNTLKPRNLVAKDLRTPKYRMRVAVSKKRYNRKSLKRITHGHSEGFEV
jgi:hypothetical protein